MAVLNREQMEAEVNTLLTSLNNINETFQHYDNLKRSQGADAIIASQKIQLSNVCFRKDWNSVGFYSHSIEEVPFPFDSQNRTPLNYLLDQMYN